MKPGIGRVRCVEKVGTPPDREEKPLVPLPPGRCRRCGEEKSWLRPGETCARCLVPSGPPPRREWDDEEDEVETITLPTNGVYSTGDVEPPESGGTILRTCPVCHEAFEANGRGRPRVYCSMFCKRKQARAGGSPAPRAETKPSPVPVVERATCPVCGDEFTAEPGRVNCSRACTVRAADLRRRERERTAAGSQAQAAPERTCLGMPDLAAWRLLHGVSQVRAGVLLGVTERTVVRWESGVTTPPPELLSGKRSDSSTPRVNPNSANHVSALLRTWLYEPKRRDEAFASLRAVKPDLLLKAAVSDFRAHGNQERLIVALNAISDHGRTALEALVQQAPVLTSNEAEIIFGALPSDLPEHEVVADRDPKPETVTAPVAPPPPEPAPPPAAAPAHPDDGGWSLIREIGRAFIARVHAQETAGRRS